MRDTNAKRSVGLRVNVSEEEHRKLAVMAAEQERSIASLVRLGIRCLFEQRPREEGSSQ